MSESPVNLSRAARRMLTQVKVDDDLLKTAHTPLYDFQLTAVIDLANWIGVPASSVVRAAVQHLLDAHAMGNPGQLLAQSLQAREPHEVRAQDSAKATRAEAKMAALPDTSIIFGKKGFVKETTLTPEWVAALREHAARAYPNSQGAGVSDLCKEAVGMLYRYLRIVGFTDRMPYGQSLELLVPLTGLRRSLLLRAALLLYIKHYKLKV